LPDTSAWVAGKDYVRADTGDDFDDRFDAVIRVEDVELDANGILHIKKTVTVEPDSMVNPKGAMLKEGDILHAKGTPLRSFDLSTLAAGGITRVPVLRKPRVAFIPTASELVSAGTMPGRGQIIDSNSVLARFVIAELGGEPVLLPIVKDDPQALEQALDEALSTADIVIVNGGSSKGLEDFNTRLLAGRGELLCHGVAAAPGRPLSATIVDGKPVINAPGPALALFYVLEWCINPLIARALDVPPRQRPIVQAVLAEDFARPPMPNKAKGKSGDKDGSAGKDGGPGGKGSFGKGGPGGPAVKMELLRKVRVTRTADGYAAEPIAFRSPEGLNWKGYSTGQIIGAPNREQVKGSIVEVELLSPPEYL
jgi:molybdopterin molybdotransferase/putative molybdopterin biosynthesis protein